MTTTVCKKTRPHWLGRVVLSFPVLPPFLLFSFCLYREVPRGEGVSMQRTCIRGALGSSAFPDLVRLAGDTAHPCGRARCHT